MDEDWFQQKPLILEMLAVPGLVCVFVTLALAPYINIDECNVLKDLIN